MGECVLRDETALVTMSYLAYSGGIVIRAIEREDRFPKVEAGEERECWAKRTPCRLIP